MKSSDLNSYKANIWKLYLARFIGTFELVAAIFVLYILSNGLTMTQVMILQAFFTICIFVMEVPSGVIADLFGLKKSLFVAEIFIGAGFLAYALSDSFYLFMIAEFIIAVGYSLYSGADSAFLYDTLKEIKSEKEFKKINGNVNAITLLSLGLGSIFGGFLASLVGYKPLFYITSALMFIGGLIILSAKEPNPYKNAGDKKYFKHLKEGINYVRGHSEIKKYILYYSVFSCFTYMLFMLTQPYYKEGGLSLTMIGFGVSGFFIFNAIGYFLSDRITRYFDNDDKILLIILSICALLFILISFSNIVLGFILISILMFFSAIKEIIIEHKVNKFSISSHRATILSIKNMSRTLLYSTFAPIVGFLTDVYSLRIAILMIGIILVIHFVFVMFLFSGSKYKSKQSK